LNKLGEIVYNKSGAVTYGNLQSKKSVRATLVIKIVSRGGVLGVKTPPPKSV